MALILAMYLQIVINLLRFIRITSFNIIVLRQGSKEDNQVSFN